MVQNMSQEFKQDLYSTCIHSKRFHFTTSTPAIEQVKDAQNDNIPDFLRKLTGKEVIVTLDNLNDEYACCNKKTGVWPAITRVIFGAVISGAGCGYGYCLLCLEPVNSKYLINLDAKFKDFRNYTAIAKLYAMEGKISELVEKVEFKDFRAEKQTPDARSISDLFIINTKTSSS